MRLHKKITISMLLTAMLPLAFSGSLALWSSTNQTAKLTLDTAQGRLDTAAQKLSLFFSERIAEISTYSQTSTMKTMDFKSIRPFLMAELVRHEDVYEKYILGTPEGYFYNTSGGNPGLGGLRTFNDKDPKAKPKHIRKRDYWQQTVGKNSAREQRTYVSDPMISYTTGAKQVVVASTILSAAGEVKGMIGGALPWTDIQDRIQQAHDTLDKQLSWNAKFFLISHSGTYWHHWDADKIVHLKLDETGNPFINDIGEKEIVKYNIHNESIPEFVFTGARMARGESGYTSFIDPESNKANYIIFSPIPSAKYSIGIVVPRAQIMAPVQDLQRMFFYTFFAALVFVIFVAFIISRKISSPITYLSKMAKEISQGNWDIKPTPVGNDEIRELTESFNAMSESLERREHALKLSEETLENINSELEQRITERTKALETANSTLKEEVHERIVTEKSLRKSEALLNKTGRLAHVGGWKLDTQNGQLEWTDETLRIHGTTSENVRNIDSILTLYSPESQATFKAAIENTINLATPFDKELELATVNGAQKWLRVICHAEKENGKVTELVGAYQDITELKVVEQLKNEFVSVVSHELRTPLTSIQGSLSLITSGKLLQIENEKAKKMLDIAERNSERLLLLINDLLDVEKIESGRIDFNIASHGLTELLRQSIAENESYGKRYGITNVLLPTISNVAINVDKERFLQVMSNLLSNAAKFTAAKTAVNISAEKADESHIRISVTDHGQGISDAFKDKIFTKFSQEDGSDTRAKGGTGLGLCICKSIVEQMGGEIGYNTVVGKGSTFYFTVPITINP